MAPTTVELSPQHPPPSNDPTKNLQGFLHLPTPPSITHISPLLIAMVLLFSSSFLIALSYFLYSALSSSSPPRSQRTHPRLHRSPFDQSVDVSNYHPGWFITTAGLQKSVIESIAVCEYKTGDRLVLGTACAVCLAEFEDGESLRMLPTCRHAFHVPCIDTWLASHTTCPICRALVLPSSLSDEGAQSIEIGDDLGFSLEVSVQDDGGVIERERDTGRPIRRAASMDRLGGKLNPSTCSSATSNSCNSLAERSLSCSGNLFSSSRNELR